MSAVIKSVEAFRRLPRIAIASAMFVFFLSTPGLAEWVPGVSSSTCGNITTNRSLHDECIQKCENAPCPQVNDASVQWCMQFAQKFITKCSEEGAQQRQLNAQWQQDVEQRTQQTHSGLDADTLAPPQSVQPGAEPQPSIAPPAAPVKPKAEKKQTGKQSQPTKKKPAPEQQPEPEARGPLAQGVGGSGVQPGPDTPIPPPPAVPAAEVQPDAAVISAGTAGGTVSGTIAGTVAGSPTAAVVAAGTNAAVVPPTAPPPPPAPQPEPKRDETVLPPPPPTLPVQPAKATEAEDPNKKQKLKKEEEEDNSLVVSGTDACKTAMAIGARRGGRDYSCDAANNMVEAAKVTNAATQMVGSAAVSAIGASNMSSAQEKGTMSAQYDAAGDTAVTTGQLQIGTGAINAVMGAVQLKYASAHKKIAQEVGNVEARERDKQTGKDIYEKERGTAIGEHAKAAKDAQAGAITSFITAGQQMMSGGFSIASGNKMKDAAKNMASAEEKAQQMTPFNFGNTNSGSDNSAPGSLTAIRGDGKTADESAATDDGQAPPEDTTLGPGFNNNFGNDLKNPGPTPGQLGGGGSPGGGGGGGGISGGSTSAATGGGEDGPTSRLADNAKNPNGYEAAGGGGFGGGKGAAATAGPDLSGLLAQFLPKKDEDAGPRNGILDFGSRDPAGEGPISLLDKKANIFERISKTYQEKQTRGYVGSGN